MEHKLIQGGSEYLPFARSRIKALRATGLKYASQKFEIDGVSIRVRIAGEHEYIDLSGGCELKMDSGVVDIGATFFENPLSYLAAELYESEYAKQYNLAFVGTEPVSDWRIKSPPSAIGNLTGDVKSSAALFRAKVPYSGAVAASFTPATDADDWLLIKKIAATYCPASVFTGKCRLYVQAMYGLPLYSGKEVNAFPVPVASGSNTPSITVASYKRNGDSSDYPRVAITTSSGVYLDKVTGKHWLFFIGYEAFSAYPLVSSGCGESLRKFIASESGKPSGLKLTQQDRDHLEAYILARCLPDTRDAVSMPLGAAIPTYAMGYGWHWNWSGTSADIVSSQRFTQREVGVTSYEAMESTHYRVSPLYTDGAWQINLSVVEGPTQWAVARPYWCITEPNWLSYTQTKVTPRETDMLECDAPFYAFYQKDVLQVCRVNVTYNELSTERQVSDAAFGSSVPFSSVAAFTNGLLGGSCKDLAATEYHTASFSCGGYATPDLHLNWARGGRRVEVKDKLQTSAWTAGFAYGTKYNQIYRSGYLPYAETVLDGVYSDEFSATVEFSYIDVVTSITKTGVVAIVIPTFDSEAIFFKPVTYTQEAAYGFNSRRSTNNLEFSAFVKKAVHEGLQTVGGITTPNGVLTEFVRYAYDGPWRAGWAELSIDNSYVEPYELVVDSDDTKLICAGLVTDVSFGSLDRFFNNTEEEIVTRYDVMSGVNTVTPLIFAKDRLPGGALNGGDAPLNIQSPAIVGWA